MTIPSFSHSPSFRVMKPLCVTDDNAHNATAISCGWYRPPVIEGSYWLVDSAGVLLLCLWSLFYLLLLLMMMACLVGILCHFQSSYISCSSWWLWLWILPIWLSPAADFTIISSVALPLGVVCWLLWLGGCFFWGVVCWEVDKLADLYYFIPTGRLTIW